MLLISYNLCGHQVPMVDFDGTLYLTVHCVLDILGRDFNFLPIKDEYPEDFAFTTLGRLWDAHKSADMSALMKHLLICEYPRNMGMWSLEDVLSITYRANIPSNTCKQIRSDYLQILKQHARYCACNTNIQ